MEDKIIINYYKSITTAIKELARVEKVCKENKIKYESALLDSREDEDIIEVSQKFGILIPTEGIFTIIRIYDYDKFANILMQLVENPVQEEQDEIDLDEMTNKQRGII